MVKRKHNGANFEELGINHLSAEDRLTLAEAIWESVAREMNQLPPTEAQRRDSLERRLADRYRPARGRYFLGGGRGTGAGEGTTMNLPVVLRNKAQADSTKLSTTMRANIQPLMGVDFAETRVQQVFDRLSANPFMHAVVFADIRKAVVTASRIAFITGPDATRVEILAVFHSSRDPSIWQGRR